MTLLSVKNLRIPYSKKGILPLLSFELNEGALVFVAGSNGIGKSTLLRQLSGNIASHRSITINHKILEEYSIKEKSLVIGFLEQTNTIEFPLLVKDLVVMGLYNRKSSLASYTSEDYQRVWNTLNELGIDYLYEQNFLTLSGGEQQLCLIAQLSLQDPDIMLLDEPTQNLDLYNKEKVFTWLNHQAQQKGKIVICVTHDLNWLTSTKGFLLKVSTSQNVLIPLNESTLKEVISSLKQRDA